MCTAVFFFLATLQRYNTSHTIDSQTSLYNSVSKINTKIIQIFNLNLYTRQTFAQEEKEERKKKSSQATQVNRIV